MCPGPVSLVHCVLLKSKLNCQPVSAEHPRFQTGWDAQLLTNAVSAGAL